MNRIQQDAFNLLHNRRGKFSLLHNMRCAKCTICDAQRLSICWKSIFFARQNECTGVLLALHANNWLYGRIFHNSRIFLQNINISNRIRFKRAQYSRFVSKFWTGISVHGDIRSPLSQASFDVVARIKCTMSSAGYRPLRMEIIGMRVQVPHLSIKAFYRSSDISPRSFENQCLQYWGPISFTNMLWQSHPCKRSDKSMISSMPYTG